MKIDAALHFNGTRFPARIDLAVLAELQRRQPDTAILNSLSQGRLDVLFDLAAEALRTGARRAGLPQRTDQEYKDLLADHPDQIGVLMQAISDATLVPGDKKDMGAADHPPTPAALEHPSS